jgi:hypothetical protein
MKKKDDTKLPPIGKKGALSGKQSTDGAAKAMSRNPSKQSQLFGAKSIDLLKSL